MENSTSRRNMFRVVAAGAAVATAAAVAGAATPAEAYQGNMERALSSLYEALASLREAPANKGGHRGNAMNLIRQAISEVEAGIDFADDH